MGSAWEMGSFTITERSGVIMLGWPFADDSDLGGHLMIMSILPDHSIALSLRADQATHSILGGLPMLINIVSSSVVE